MSLSFGDDENKRKDEQPVETDAVVENEESASQFDTEQSSFAFGGEEDNNANDSGSAFAGVSSFSMSDFDEDEDDISGDNTIEVAPTKITHSPLREDAPEESAPTKKAKRGRRDKKVAEDSENLEEPKKKRGGLFGRKESEDEGDDYDFSNMELILDEEDEEDKGQERTGWRRFLPEMPEKNPDKVASKFQKKLDKTMPAGSFLAIDLTPESYRKIIALRRQKRTWVYSFLLIFAACVGYSLYLYSDFAKVDAELQQEVALSGEVDAQIAEFSEINNALNARDRGRTFTTEAAASEIRWSSLVQGIQSSLPSGTSITSMNVEVNQNAQGEVAAVVFANLSATTTTGYSDAIGALNGINGVSQVQIGDMTSSGDGFTFSVAFAYDGSIRTGEYLFDDDEEGM